MGNIYAMKCEDVNAQIQVTIVMRPTGKPVSLQVLKLEVFVLSELKKKNGRHFCEMMDKGRFQGFNYVVMTFVGKCLEVW